MSAETHAYELTRRSAVSLALKIIWDAIRQKQVTIWFDITEGEE